MRCVRVLCRLVRARVGVIAFSPRFPLLVSTKSARERATLVLDRLGAVVRRVLGVGALAPSSVGGSCRNPVLSLATAAAALALRGQVCISRALWTMEEFPRQEQRKPLIGVSAVSFATSVYSTKQDPHRIE